MTFEAVGGEHCGIQRGVGVFKRIEVIDLELIEVAEDGVARAAYASASLDQDQVAAVRAWARRLQQEAPAYLRPSAQMNLAVSPEDCLTILERAVSWRAESLYGVEGEGPFDEF